MCSYLLTLFTSPRISAGLFTATKQRTRQSRTRGLGCSGYGGQRSWRRLNGLSDTQGNFSQVLSKTTTRGKRSKCKFALPPVSSSHHNHVPLARLRTPCAVLTLQHDELLESEYSPHTFFTRYEWDEVEGVIVGWEDKSPTAPAPAAAPPAAAPAQADPVRAPEAAPLSPLCLRLAFVKHLHRQAQPQPHPHRQWNPSTRR